MYKPLEMLKDQLNWSLIMTQPRNAGGHTEIMDCLFTDAKVLASVVEDDCQGTLGYVYQLTNNDIAIVSDYFGSCSGCDSYENASDAEVRNLCIQLANNAHVFPNTREAFLFLREAKQDNAAYFELKGLVDPLIKELYKNRIIKIDEILTA